jgi:N-methylhydantoinase B
MIALQLRSQAAGLRAGRQRMLEAIEKYGPRVVKGTMRRMIRDCSTAVGERLSAIPDGEWKETGFTSRVGPNDTHVHRETMSIRKVGNRLICSNVGTDLQCLAGNSAFSSWRSCLVAAASALFAYDQLFCPAGVVEHMDFVPIPGTRNVATFPAAISANTSTNMNISLAGLIMSKMALSATGEIRLGASAAGGTGCGGGGWMIGSGLTRRGVYVADAAPDNLFGGIGGFPDHDGIDTGGAWWLPRSLAGNAEQWESVLPMLYLYRSEKQGSGGAGQYRGGNGLEIGIIGHKTNQFEVQIHSIDPAVTGASGLAGGMPGHGGNHLYVGSSSIRSAFRAKKMPTSIEEIDEMAGCLTRVAPKSSQRLLEDDVLVIAYCASGGFGDPLDRDSAAVATDVATGAISAAQAKEMYGVILEDGHIKKEATDTYRADRRHGRLERSVAVTAPSTLSAEFQAEGNIFPGLLYGTIGDDFAWACESCHTPLGPMSQNYKLATVFSEQSLHEVDPAIYPRVADFCEDNVVLRSYFCPGCARQFAAEVVPTELEHIWDYQRS